MGMVFFLLVQFYLHIYRGYCRCPSAYFSCTLGIVSNPDLLVSGSIRVVRPMRLLRSVAVVNCGIVAVEVYKSRSCSRLSCCFGCNFLVVLVFDVEGHPFLMRQVGSSHPRPGEHWVLIRLV